MSDDALPLDIAPPKRRRILAPPTEQNKAGRLMDLVAPHPTPPNPVETLVKAWLALAPQERVRFLTGGYTLEEWEALRTAIVARIHQETSA